MVGRLQDGLEAVCRVGNASSDSSEKETPRVLLALAATLERLVTRNEKCLKDVSEHRKLTVYHGLRPPNISILKYLERINKYSCCSPSCFIVGFIFIDHLIHKQPDVPLISLNVHRLLITSIMVATKLLDDVHYNNAFYARVGGISNAELNSLEIDFLFRLDFRLQVPKTMFEGYCTHLEREMVFAGQWIQRTLPNSDESSPDREKQLMLENAERKARLISGQNSMADGTARVVRAPISPATNMLES